MTRVNKSRDRRIGPEPVLQGRLTLALPKEPKLPELEEFTVKELRAIAKADGVTIKSNMRKAQLITAIKG